jgi:hypothetical protein
VSQISPPIRILVVLAIAVTGVYMLFMRPKTEVVPPAEPAPNTQTSEPAVSEPGKVAEAAQDAVQAANGQLSEQESVDGVDAGETAAGTTASGTKTDKPSTGDAATTAGAQDLKGLPKPIAKALRKDKVLVLLFWNGKSADDKAVHAALKKVDRWNGRVSVQSASIKQIAKYGRISRGVDVEQSPTIVIADRDLRAETLVGYVDKTTIDQAVLDAMRNSGRVFTSAYLREADSVCVHHSNLVAAVPGYYAGADLKQLDTRLAAYDQAAGRFVGKFKAVKAPKRWRAYDTAAVADLTAIDAAISQFSVAVTPKSSVASVIAADRQYRVATTPVQKRMNRRFAREGLFRCGSDF